MTTSYLKGVTFYCREWAYEKLVQAFSTTTSTAGPALGTTTGATNSNTAASILISGGPGSGKTAFCTEIVWPTVLNSIINDRRCDSRQVVLRSHLLTHYFCRYDDIDTLSPARFLRSLIEQLLDSDHVDFTSVYDEAAQEASTWKSCEDNIDVAFRSGILEPLLRLKYPPQRRMMILIDGLDESTLIEGDSIAALLARNKLPSWLVLVASCRTQDHLINGIFTGYKKICLDDLRKSHAIRDVQQYILSRLDKETALRRRLSRDTAEMLNILHIKSNGCFLYMQQVLDGVVAGRVSLREIRDMPGTLNGMYLWLCERMFTEFKVVVRPILNVMLAARRPLTRSELYSCAYTRNVSLKYTEFVDLLKQMSPLVSITAGTTSESLSSQSSNDNETDNDASTVNLHQSFADWLLDVKHCTKKYLCSKSDGHGTLAMSFSLHASILSASEIEDYALHLTRSDVGSTLTHQQLAAWLLWSGANIDSIDSDYAISDASVVKLLKYCGANISTPASTLASVESDPLASLQMDTLNIDERTTGATTTTSSTTSSSSKDLQMLRSRLYSACSDGDVSTIQRVLVKAKQLINVSDSEGRTALNLAARHGHIGAVEALLMEQADPNIPDNAGWTPLRAASWGGYLDTVSRLLHVGAAVDACDRDGRTALRAAAWGGHQDVVACLLHAGAAVGKVDIEGRTAVIAAAYMGHSGVVRTLLSRSDSAVCSSDVDHADVDCRTALTVAAMGRSHECVEALLVGGASVDHRDLDGMTPLLVAAFEGRLKSCELLLKAGADVDDCDSISRSSIHVAVLMGHCEVVRLLIRWHCNVDTIDAQGRSLLSLASTLPSSGDIVRELLARGMDEQHRDNDGQTPLHLAAQEGHNEVVKLLIDTKMNLETKDNEGHTALYHAAKYGRIEVVRSLIDIGASSQDSKGHDGKSALRIACLQGHYEVVALLLRRKGSDVNDRDLDGRTILYSLTLSLTDEKDSHQTTSTASGQLMKCAEILIKQGHALCDLSDSEGRVPLHIAAWEGHLAVVQLLVNLGDATVDALDNSNRTPLQSAAWQGHAHIVTWLLSRGAQVEHCCSQGATALCIASQEGHKSVVKALLAFDANPHRTDSWNRTAIKQALKAGHMDIVKLLEGSCSTLSSNTSSQHLYQSLASVNRSNSSTTSGGAGGSPALPPAPPSRYCSDSTTPLSPIYANVSSQRAGLDHPQHPHTPAIVPQTVSSRLLAQAAALQGSSSSDLNVPNNHMTTSDARFSLDAECAEYERGDALAPTPTTVPNNAFECSSESSSSGGGRGLSIAPRGMSNQSFAQCLFSLGDDPRRRCSLDRNSTDSDNAAEPRRRNRIATNPNAARKYQLNAANMITSYKDLKRETPL